MLMLKRYLCNILEMDINFLCFTPLIHLSLEASDSPCEVAFHRGHFAAQASRLLRVGKVDSLQFILEVCIRGLLGYQER